MRKHRFLWAAFCVAALLVGWWWSYYLKDDPISESAFVDHEVPPTIFVLQQTETKYLKITALYDAISGKRWMVLDDGKQMMVMERQIDPQLTFQPNAAPPPPMYPTPNGLKEF